MLKRGSGILLHISSLPSPYGIGDLGPSARRFVDFLHQSGQTYWQVLPLNPTDTVYGNSPYSSYSAFAGNTLFISPEMLVEDGWLLQEDLSGALSGFPQENVNYAAVTEYKTELFPPAYLRFKRQAGEHKEYQEFCAANAFWLEDYAAFVAFKEHFAGKSWDTWPDGIRSRTPQAVNALCAQLSEAIARVKFLQYVFFKQWFALKHECRQKNIRLIGDIPIYVNYDSADVWANPKLFKLDETSRPRFVAGVPPDYFSETGQRWGNPLYDWEALRTSGYDWWVKRVRHNFDNFDLIRIDHFRGFVGYWQIPADEKTAVRGRWIPGPGDDFFRHLQKTFTQLPIIAEDLGIITPDVTDTMQKFDFPGMKVLLFAFAGDIKTHPYIPDNYPSHCVAYTGTHDNNTIQGWLRHDATKGERENFFSYLGTKDRNGHVHWDLIGRIMKSQADIAVIPMQDILGLGGEARMNKPATTSGNWQWRLSQDALTPHLTEKLRHITEISQRAGVYA